MVGNTMGKFKMTIIASPFIELTFIIALIVSLKFHRIFITKYMHNLSFYSLSLSLLVNFRKMKVLSS